ncbi:MAG TPA: nicotinate phosphoribosyltransferase [Sulfurimonas sp. UBA12504]|nr:MAG: nicotinate phosphoribosyltransferase [Sulfurimonas sp. GWF2_37_8]DAB29650.1 MAG TPA: nicotinate phosphoribosyltransferase [Sulfurimonas sp. UBA12504]
MKYYAYEEFRNDTNTLIKKVRDFHPEALLAIARGGLTLAHAMAEGLDIREVQSIQTELYDKTCKRDTITIFDTCVFENRARILVIDDIADSGETLEAIMKHLVKKYPQIEFKSATLFYKTTSIYEPNFWVKEADDWIDFFWERDFIL